jgi:hypothetical protein
MRKVLLFFAFIIVVIIILWFALAFSGSSPNEEARWGYIDKTGATVIKPSFGLAESFSEGYALVYLPDGKAYSGARIINKEGSVLFNPPPDIEILGAVKQGLAVIKNSNEPRYSKAGFISPSGTIAIPLTFANADDFTQDGLAHVALPDEKTTALANVSGIAIVPEGDIKPALLYRGSLEFLITANPCLTAPRISISGGGLKRTEPSLLIIRAPE